MAASNRFDKRLRKECLEPGGLKSGTRQGVHHQGSIPVVGMLNFYMRSTTVIVAVLLAINVLFVPSAAAGPTVCDYPACTPGIAPNVVLGAPCTNTTYYVFGVTAWGRLVFCGSPRRFDPRWFRSPIMDGIKEEDTLCPTHDTHVAQAPDGLFLACVAHDAEARWVRGDL